MSLSKYRDALKSVSHKLWPIIIKGSKKISPDAQHDSPLRSILPAVSGIYVMITRGASQVLNFRIINLTTSKPQTKA
jgi:hypothetical protein